MKKYENLLILLIFVAFIVLIGGSLAICKKYPPLSIIYSIMAAVAAYIVHKRSDINKINKNIVAVMCSLVCIVSLLFLLFMKDKYSAYAMSLFVKGNISYKEMLVEGDEETVDHYETKYFFTPKKSGLEDYKELISWLFASVAFISFYISFTALKLNPDEPKRSKYTY
jgi:uncharacterized membrane protein YkvI